MGVGGDLIPGLFSTLDTPEELLQWLEEQLEQPTNGRIRIGCDILTLLHNEMTFKPTLTIAIKGVVSRLRSIMENLLKHLRGKYRRIELYLVGDGRVILLKALVCHLGR